jgi:hypothetical protein
VVIFNSMARGYCFDVDYGSNVRGQSAAALGELGVAHEEVQKALLFALKPEEKDR